jgi:hypothetical protein
MGIYPLNSEIAEIFDFVTISRMLEKLWNRTCLLQAGISGFSALWSQISEAQKYRNSGLFQNDSTGRITQTTLRILISFPETSYFRQFVQYF